MSKIYLGDAVYADSKDGMITLTTHADENDTWTVDQLRKTVYEGIPQPKEWAVHTGEAG